MLVALTNVTSMSRLDYLIACRRFLLNRQAPWQQDSCWRNGASSDIIDVLVPGDFDRSLLTFKVVQPWASTKGRHGCRCGRHWQISCIRRVELMSIQLHRRPTLGYKRRPEVLTACHHCKGRPQPTLWQSYIHYESRNSFTLSFLVKFCTHIS